MINHALNYSKRGWHIFPCGSQAKTPLTKHGCKDATTDEKTINAWWTRWPDANIGLACGKLSGVYAVDIDYDPDRSIDGFESLEEFPESMPPTAVQLTPRGGAHYLFKSKAPPANKNSFRNGIDIRGEGYYIVLAPSTHPNGKKYQWMEKHGPDEIELAEYPDHLKPAKEAPVLPWEQPKQTLAEKKTTGPGLPRTDVIDRARLYLQECEPATQGQAGHDALLWAARALVTGFELDDITANQLLWDDFNHRCNPSWDPGDSKDVKDFERKVKEARRNPSTKPSGWLLTEYGLNQNDEGMLEYGRNLAEGLLIKIPEKEPEKTPHIESVSKPKPTTDFPEWLLTPPGLAGDICSWINSTALKDQPLLTLGAVLPFCGALFGRKVRDQWNNRTNLYSMGVAPSSAGKEHARDQLKRLIELAGINEILGGENVTGDAAIERRLVESPSIYFPMDEIGHMMTSIKTSGGVNPHLASIVPVLMKLYSAAKSTYYGKEYANQERRVIVQPCACLYGTTTPEKLCDGISPAEIEDGWLGRVLIFISNTNPDKQWTKHITKPVPEHLRTQVQAWWTRMIPAPADTSDIDAATGVFQLVLPTNAQAHECFMQLESECNRMAKKNQNKGVDKLWLKAGENARRLALTIAAGDRFDNPEITAMHADWACQLTTALLNKTVDLVENHVVESIYEKDKQKIFRIIQKAGSKGIPKSVLAQRTSKHSKRQRDDHLADLQEQQKVVIGSEPGKRALQVWAYPYGLKEKKEGK